MSQGLRKTRSNQTQNANKERIKIIAEIIETNRTIQRIIEEETTLLNRGAAFSRDTQSNSANIEH